MLAVSPFLSPLVKEHPMRITIGRGNKRQSVSAPSGKAYKSAHKSEQQRFVRQFCQIVGIKR